MNQQTGARVAVVGARGIGRHHARWWSLEGANVCAIVGTTPETAEEARAGLAEAIEFDGAVYTSIEELLEKEFIEIVDVCSPYRQHAEQVRQALMAGCNVVCEKPFIYDPDASWETQMETARELVELTKQQHRRLAVCLQYTRAAEHVLKYWLEAKGWTPIERLSMELRTDTYGREPDPERIWLDLAPHPLSFMHRLMPDGLVDWDTLNVEFESAEARAGFVLREPTGQSIEIDITVANTPDPGEKKREFVINDVPIQFKGSADERGVYCIRMITPDGEQCVTDFLREFIRAFLWNEATTRFGEILLNQEWTLRMLEAGRANVKKVAGA